MKYDIVKDKLAFYISIFPYLRKCFFSALNILILRQQYVLELIRTLYPNSHENIKMYDAGGGYLQYTDYVLNKYPNSQVHAVDIKEDYIEQYSDYIKDKEVFQRYSYACGDLQTYLPEKEFDLIIAIDIMEHIEDDISTLDNFYNSLNQNGKLVISTPSTFDEAAAFTEEHVRPGYDKDELISKIEKSGFKIDSIKYTYGKFGAIYWKLCLKTPLTLLNRHKLFYLIMPIYFILTFPMIKLFMILDKKMDNKKGNGLLVVASKK